MPVAIIFQAQMFLGYAAWIAWFLSYGLPRVKATAPEDVHRAIAALHSFRFFGLVFLVPGVVGTDIPQTFARFAAYGDLATGFLALTAVISFPVRRIFWIFVVAFNLCGICDLLGNYYHAVEFRLPEMAGQLGAAYLIPVIYVPLLMVTHVLAFCLLFRRLPR